MASKITAPILISIFLSIASLNSANAKKELYIGVKTGLSIPSLQAGEGKNIWNKNYQSIIRPYFSIFSEYSISEHFSLQAEIAYAAQGGKRTDIQPMNIPEQYVDIFKLAFKTDNDFIFANLNSTSHINFIQVPVMLKYSVPIALKNKLKFFALAGPYFGYMVSAKQYVKSDDLHVYVTEETSSEIPQFLVKGFFGSSIDTTINSYPELHKFNMGIQGGIGFSYQLGKSKIAIEGGGNYGFLYLQKDDDHGKNNIGAGTVLISYAYNIRKNK